MGATFLLPHYLTSEVGRFRYSQVNQREEPTMNEPRPIVPPFTVLPWTDGNGIAVLTVIGELDFYTVRGLRWHLLQLESTPSTLIVLDLARVSFIDSCGVGLLIFGSKRLTAAGNDLRLAAVPNWTSDLLKRLGVLKLFDVFDTVESAIASSSGRVETAASLCETLPSPQSA
jgi:anti-sigma B factor antagonist